MGNPFLHVARKRFQDKKPLENVQANISAMSQYSPAIRRWYHLLHQQSTRMHPHEVAECDSKKTPARVVVLLMITASKNFGTYN